MATTERSHYEVLGVSPEATEADIKAAYRKLAKTLHPDMPTGSQALFGVVCEAYEVLSKADRRAAYDRSRSGRPAAGSSTTSSTTSSSTAGNGTGPSSTGTGKSRTSGDRTGTNQSGYSSGATAGHQQTATGPFSRAYAAAAAGERYTSPWTHRSTPTPAQQQTFARPQTGEGRGKGGSIAWWSLPLVLAVTFGAALLRYTGMTAALFGVHVGDTISFGRTWAGTPGLFAGGLAATAKAAGLVAVLCVGLVAGFWWRKQQAPTARAEKVVILVVWGFFVATFDLWLTSALAWLVTAGVVAAYAGWVWTLKQLPAPACVEQWESFGEWAKGVRAYEERVSAARQQRRQTARRQRRDQLGRIIHWK